MLFGLAATGREFPLNKNTRAPSHYQDDAIPEDMDMKTTLVALGLAGALLVGQSTPARAINKEWSAVAGFVGGLLVANAGSCDRGYSRPVVYQQPVQQVFYQPAPTVVVYEQPVPSGHYEWRTERRFVPGRWFYEDLGCGNRRRIWQPGHYQNTRIKVWVDDTCYNGW